MTYTINTSANPNESPAPDSLIRWWLTDEQDAIVDAGYEGSKFDARRAAASRAVERANGGLYKLDRKDRTDDDLYLKPSHRKVRRRAMAGCELDRLNLSITGKQRQTIINVLAHGLRLFGAHGTLLDLKIKDSHASDKMNLTVKIAYIGDEGTALVLNRKYGYWIIGVRGGVLAYKGANMAEFRGRKAWDVGLE